MMTGKIFRRRCKTGTSKGLKKIAAKTAACLLCIAIAAGGMGDAAYAGEAKDTLLNKQESNHTYVPVLMYHHFAEEIQSHGRSGATITTDKFRGDMEYLQENGYTALLPQDLKSIAEGKKKLPEKPIIITLDDGYESAYTIAYPVLEETGMRATVFAIVGGVENPRKNEIKKLSWEQMRKMYESGVMDIQSHSYNLHNQQYKGKFDRYMPNGIEKGVIECRAQYDYRVEPDIVKSIELIEENVGNDVVCFSYPYGAYEEWGRELLEKHGVLFGFGTRYGMADLKDNLYYMNRFSVGMTTDLSQIIESL